MLLTSPTSLAPLADLTLAAKIVSRHTLLARQVLRHERVRPHVLVDVDVHGAPPLMAGPGGREAGRMDRPAAGSTAS